MFKLLVLLFVKHFFHFLFFADFFHYSYKFLFRFKYSQEVSVFYQGFIYIFLIFAEVFPLNLTISCAILFLSHPENYYIDLLFPFFRNELHNKLHQK